MAEPVEPYKEEVGTILPTHPEGGEEVETTTPPSSNGEEIETTPPNDFKSPSPSTAGAVHDDKEMWDWIHSIAKGVGASDELEEQEEDDNSVLIFVPRHYMDEVKNRMERSLRWRDKVIWSPIKEPPEEWCSFRVLGLRAEEFMDSDPKGRWSNKQKMELGIRESIEE